MDDWQLEASAPINTAVLVWDGAFITVAEKYVYTDHNSVWYVHNTYGFCEDGSIPDVTHWMPLPDEPK